MTKIKIFLLTFVLVFSTYSVTSASNVIEFPVTEEAYEYSDEETDAPSEELDKSKEIQVAEEHETEVTIDDLSNGGEQITEQDIYTVIEGDNLFRIALTHEIPLDELMSWNDLEVDLIHPGDELVVNGEKVGDAKVQADKSEKPTISSQSVAAPKSSMQGNSSVKELLVTATAYTAYCKGCSGTTAYGIDLRSNPNQKVIAVDPKLIPLGTRVWVEGYGEAIAGDIGGAIKGHKIDVFIPAYESAMEWGVKKVKMRVLK